MRYDDTSNRRGQHFTCPDCAGPLHVREDGHFECEIGHHYELDAAVSAHTGQTTQALMRAVSSLRDRAAMSRWASRNPEMYPGRNLAGMQEAAAVDDEMADTLVRHARALEPGTGRRHPNGG